MSEKIINGKTNLGLVEYAEAQIGLPYWCGTFGQVATQALYEYNKKRLPAYYTASDFPSQFGKRVHDCIGLIKGYMWSETPTSVPEYNASQDYSVEKMYSAATVKGSIATIENNKKDGLLVFTSSLSHVGVYVNGNVIQAVGHAYGVVKTPFYPGVWGYWAECPFISYGNTPKPEPEDIDYTKFDVTKLPELYYGKSGKAVRVWQEIVDVIPDGIFGNKTKDATIKYQKIWFPNDSSEWDGVVGKKTWYNGLSILR